MPYSIVGILPSLSTMDYVPMNPSIKKIDTASEYYFEEGCFINELSNSSMDSASADAGDEDLSIALARVESGKTTKWHALEGISERYVIQQGSGRVEIGDLPPQEVSCGDVVFIPPMVKQRITNLGDRDLVFLAICSPPFSPKSYIDLEI